MVRTRWRAQSSITRAITAPSSAAGRRGAWPRSTRGTSHRSRHDPLCQARLHLVVLARQRADLYFDRLELSFPAIDEGIAMLSRHEKRRVGHGQAHAEWRLDQHVREHAGFEEQLRIGELEPRLKGARLLIDGGCDESNAGLRCLSTERRHGDLRGLPQGYEWHVPFVNGRLDPHASEIADAVEVG